MKTSFLQSFRKSTRTREKVDEVKSSVNISFFCSKCLLCRFVLHFVILSFGIGFLWLRLDAGGGERRCCNSY